MAKDDLDWITAIMNRDTSDLLFVQLSTGKVATMTPEEYRAYKERKRKEKEAALASPDEVKDS